MKRGNALSSFLLLICLTVTLSACQTTNTGDSGSSTVPKKDWATFDGDMSLAADAKDFYSRYRALTLGGYDLDGRRRPWVQKFKCKLRDCRLHPGQHSIGIGYYWSSFEVEKNKRREEDWANFSMILGPFLGEPGLGAQPRTYPCQASLTFEAYAAHDYALRIIHSNPIEGPEEFQIVDLASGTAVASVSAPCSRS